MTGSRASPRNCLRSSVRCSSFHHVQRTFTAPVPGTSATASLTRSVISVFFGAAGGGQVDRDKHATVASDLDVFDHSEFGDGAPQFGVDHLCQRVRIAALRSAGS